MHRTANANDWCILRTSGSRTIPLARSLAAAGFDVWTPIEHAEKRRPRSKVTIEYDAAIMPTFVFARARHLPDLAGVIAAPASPHPPFSLFRYYGAIVTLADGEISALREAEEQAAQREAARQRKKLKGERRHFNTGQMVNLSEGAFAGISGVVEEGDGKFAMVAFGGHARWKIAAFLLSPDSVIEQQGTDAIALAA